MVLRHAEHGIARVAIRRNSGAPLGVAHTDHLDFLLMNGGSGTSETEARSARVLGRLAALCVQAQMQPDADDAGRAAAAQRSAHRRARRARAGTAAAPDAAGRVAPHIDRRRAARSRSSSTRPASAASRSTTPCCGFADRCYVFLTRPDACRIGVQLKPRGETARTDALRVLVRDVVKR